MTAPLDQQVKHKVFRIVEVLGQSTIVERLLEIGFAPGEEVQIKGQMICGGPLIIEVRGTTVALRRQEAACVQVLV